jgi:hypothetical protein
MRKALRLSAITFQSSKPTSPFRFSARANQTLHIRVSHASLVHNRESQ